MNFMMCGNYRAVLTQFHDAVNTGKRLPAARLQGGAWWAGPQ